MKENMSELEDCSLDSRPQSEAAPAPAPCGSWLSSITAEDVARGAVKLSQPVYGPDGKTIYFIEGRPQEGGRQVVVKARGAAFELSDMLPAPFNARSLVHEYGGGPYVAAEDKDGEPVIYFSNFKDQRLWKASSGCAPEALTAERNYRFADYVVDRKRQRLLAIMEDHRQSENQGVSSDAAAVGAATTAVPHEPVNVICSLDLSGHEPAVLVSGDDFYAAPRLSPDGRYLAYISWNHPNMPWDGCRLHLAELDDRGAVVATAIVAGGSNWSVFQPQWCPQGRLFYVSEESGFWQPKLLVDVQAFMKESSFAPGPQRQPGPPRLGDGETCGAGIFLIGDERFLECEFGLPMWVFGQSTYAVVDSETVIMAYNRQGIWQLGRLDLRFAEGKVESRFSEIPSPFTEVSYLCPGAGRVVMLAGSAVQPLSVIEMRTADNSFHTVTTALSDLPASDYLSAPQVVAFPSPAGPGLTAYAFYYPPKNPHYRPLDGEAPPLLVKCHGGPTGGASSLFSLGIQYWTSRGFAVVDVNYGGSTGFGREYRQRLNGNWGVVDVQDSAACALYLAEQGLADGRRLAISGGSAGGYTVLSALTFTDTFRAGASHYGIGDLEALAKDTHKFESRYEDNLVAPFPQGVALYRERSPIHHVERLNCPVIFFQGLEDKVVPPNQAEAMVDALRKKGIAVAYIAYEGEQHGFRRAENIIKTIESEYYFFCKVFDIPLPANHGTSVFIENLEKCGLK